MNLPASAWTLRRRVLVMLGVVGAILLSVAGAEAVVATKNREYTDVLLMQVGPLRVQGQEMLNALLDQETGVRGYAVTGDPEDLGPYEQGLARERATAQEIRELAGKYPAIVEDLVVVEQQAQEWRRTVAQPVIDTTNSSGTAAGQALLTDESRQRFDGLRASVATLQEEILTAREATARDVERTGNLLVEVVGTETERDRLGEALAQRGLTCRPQGSMVAVDPPPPELAEAGAVHDVIRDVAAELGLGLMRLEPDRGHLEDVFLEGGAHV